MSRLRIRAQVFAPGAAPPDPLQSRLLLLRGGRRQRPRGPWGCAPRGAGRDRGHAAPAGRRGRRRQPRALRAAARPGAPAASAAPPQRLRPPGALVVAGAPGARCEAERLSSARPLSSSRELSWGDAPHVRGQRPDARRALGARRRRRATRGRPTRSPWRPGARATPRCRHAPPARTLPAHVGPPARPGRSSAVLRHLVWGPVRLLSSWGRSSLSSRDRRERAGNRDRR